MQEKAKRMKPTAQVLRELYMKSGNQCAFPGCYEPMIDDNGKFIGQVCHIEAAEEKGERFNPNMTDEERRSYDNLMLMCYKHHVETNDVNKYPVSALKIMKRQHEDKFSGIINNMLNSIVDYGYENNYLETKTCKTLSEVLKYRSSDEENMATAKVLNMLMNKLIDVPIETRCLLEIMVGRSYQDEMYNCVVPLHEIEKATGREAKYLLPHIEILYRRNIISEPEADEFNCPYCCLCGDSETGWPYWNDIREFSRKTGIPLRKICVDLDFSIFD